MPFRCDTPHLRRELEMEISALPEGLVQWSSRILREQEREPVHLLAAGLPRSALMLAICGWCKRFRAPEWATVEPWAGRRDAWWEVEHVGAMLKGLAEEDQPQVTHTVCPQCYAVVMAQLEEEVA